MGRMIKMLRNGWAVECVLDWGAWTVGVNCGRFDHSGKPFVYLHLLVVIIGLWKI